MNSSFPVPSAAKGFRANVTQAGAETTCPSCQARIIVPADVSAPTPIAPTGISTPPDNPPAFTGHTGIAAQKTSGLAIASLVCSVLSIVTCVGWLPGIICGHLAKSRIRRNSSLKGSGLATAGLFIGYLMLLAEVGTTAIYMWRISAAVKQGFAEVQHNVATNKFVITETQSMTVSNNNEPVEPAAPAPVATATHPHVEAVAAGWSADLRAVPIPNHPVSGKLHGTDFVLKGATFRNGELKLTAPNGLVLDIYRLGASVEGQNYEVQTTDDSSVNPRARMTWNEGDVEMTATFSKGYAMKLQFAQANKQRVAGKIYLCFPDEAKSYVAGTFEARLLQSQNGNGN